MPHPSTRTPRAPNGVLPLLAAVLVLASLPWLTSFYESGSWARSSRDLIASSAATLIALAFGLWVLVLLRRERDTARRHLEELEALTLTDALTGLGNRRALERELSRALLRSRRLGHPITLLFLDVDDLKHVNDRFGHGAGDEVLRMLGAVIRSCSREGVDSGYRVGGDEFVVIALTELAGAEVLANRIRAAFRERTVHHNTLSTGAVEWNGAMSAGELLNEADRLMYRDKHMARAAGAAPRARGRA